MDEFYIYARREIGTTVTFFIRKSLFTLVVATLQCNPLYDIMDSLVNVHGVAHVR